MYTHNYRYAYGVQTRCTHALPHTHTRARAHIHTFTHTHTHYTLCSLCMSPASVPVSQYNNIAQPPPLLHLRLFLRYYTSILGNNIAYNSIPYAVL